MRTPIALLRFVAKAALNAVGFGVAGEFAVEVLPDMARDVWQRWGQGQPEEQLRAEAQAVARLSPEEARQMAEEIAAEETVGQPDAVRRVLTDYLSRVPATLRRSQRRPGDPRGQTLSAGLPLRQSEDLIPFLPERTPLFRNGDRPPGIGDWELEDLLGVGGFGEVWKARNPHLAERVALKFCLDPGAVRVLRNEAALLGRVMSQGRHPGIVRLLHTYLNADTPCLEYEYVPGGDLASLLGQWGRSSVPCRPTQATRLLRELAGIVAFAHRLDPPIVHRDLKPANILLQSTGKGTLALRVTDFGIGGVAATQALARTQSGSLRGSLQSLALRGAHTPLYASPQQVRGDPPDPRDDVHALGIIWYQLLTGDLRLLSLPADWQDELAEHGLPTAAVRLLGACVASRPERRPASAAALADALDRLLERPSDQTPAPARRIVTVPAEVTAAPATPGDDLASQVRRALRHAHQAHAEARYRAEREHDYEGAVALLEDVPLPLRDPELYVVLCQRRDRIVQLDRTIREAVDAGRFARLRPLVEELLALAPQRHDLQRLLEVLPRRTPLELRIERPRAAPLPAAPEPKIDVRDLPRRLTNRAGMHFVLIPAGSFLMGSPANERRREPDEGPQHPVTITRPFYLCVYPVTQRAYAVLTGRNPSRHTSEVRGGPDHPVEGVTWDEAVAYCQGLSLLAEELVPGWTYRLPTEAEWEYACRAGATAPFAFGSSLWARQANFDGRYPYGGGRPGPFLERTSKVGSYCANAWGLYDMHGNVWEWCDDWYDRDAYAQRMESDPRGPAEGRERVLRGGSFNCTGSYCRSARRWHALPQERGAGIGFRVALAPA